MWENTYRALIFRHGSETVTIKGRINGTTIPVKIKANNLVEPQAPLNGTYFVCGYKAYSWHHLSPCIHPLSSCTCSHPRPSTLCHYASSTHPMTTSHHPHLMPSPAEHISSTPSSYGPLIFEVFILM